MDLGTQNPTTGSQKSSMFPWDNAGGSSTSGAIELLGSNDIHADAIDVRLRGSSQSQRDSPVVPSRVGSLNGGSGFSPAPIGLRNSQAIGEDYRFEGADFTKERKNHCPQSLRSHSSGSRRSICNP